MWTIGFSITIQQLKLKIAEITQTKPSPFWNLVFQKHAGGTNFKIERIIFDL
jgi:hypothetical protein